MARGGTPGVDASLATAEMVVQLAGFPGDLVGLGDQCLQPLLEYLDGGELDDLVLLERMRRDESEAVQGARDDEPPVILADLDVDAVQRKLANPAPVRRRREDEVGGVRFGKGYDLEPRGAVAAWGVHGDGAFKESLHGPQQTRCGELGAKVGGETFATTENRCVDIRVSPARLRGSGKRGDRRRADGLGKGVWSERAFIVADERQDMGEGLGVAVYQR